MASRHAVSLSSATRNQPRFLQSSEGQNASFRDYPTTYFPPSYQATEEFKQRMQGVPAGRLSTGREAAMFLLALAGPESDWIFGQVFPYAGGWVP